MTAIADGQRVQTFDGLPGRVLFAVGSASPGITEYEVMLDGGLGQRVYTAAQLRPVPEDYRSGRAPLAPGQLPAGVTAAADPHEASLDYPELGTVLSDRPDPGSSVSVIGSRTAAAQYGRPDDARDEQYSGGMNDTGTYWAEPGQQDWVQEHSPQEPAPPPPWAAMMEHPGSPVLARLAQIEEACQLWGGTNAGTLRCATTINGTQVDDHGDAPEHGTVPRASAPDDYDSRSTEGDGDPRWDDPVDAQEKKTFNGATVGMYPEGMSAGGGPGLEIGAFTAARVPWTDRERGTLHRWHEVPSGTWGDFVPSGEFTGRHEPGPVPAEPDGDDERERTASRAAVAWGPAPDEDDPRAGTHERDFEPGDWHAAPGCDRSGTPGTLRDYDPEERVSEAGPGQHASGQRGRFEHTLSSAIDERWEPWDHEEHDYPGDGSRGGSVPEEKAGGYDPYRPEEFTDIAPREEHAGYEGWYHHTLSALDPPHPHDDETSSLDSGPEEGDEGFPEEHDDLESPDSPVPPYSWPAARAEVSQGGPAYTQGRGDGNRGRKFPPPPPAPAPGIAGDGNDDGNDPGAAGNDGDGGGKKVQLEISACLAAFTASAASPSFRFHFTAAWRDVQAKAKRIRAAGHVRITHATRGMVIGEVRGDHDTYESGIQRPPGKPQTIQHWACGCPWASFHQDRSLGTRYAGRPCSHVMALQFEAQARGMFGRTVQVEEKAPSWAPPEVTVKSWPPYHGEPHGGHWNEYWQAPSSSLAPATAAAYMTLPDPRDPAREETWHRSHLEHQHGMDPAESWSLSPQELVQVHLAEHVRGGGHQHFAPEGKPGESYWPDVFEPLRSSQSSIAGDSDSPAYSAIGSLLAAGEDMADLIALAQLGGLTASLRRFTADQANGAWGSENVSAHPPQKPYGATAPLNKNQDPGSYGFLSAPDPENWGSIQEGSYLQSPLSNEASLEAGGPYSGTDPADPQGIRMEEELHGEPEAALPSTTGEDEGEELRRSAGIDGTMGDAQDVPHRPVASRVHGGCALCGLARGSAVHAASLMGDQSGAEFPQAQQPPEVTQEPGMGAMDEPLMPEDPSIQTTGNQQWSGGGTGTDETAVPAGQPQGSIDDIVASFQRSAAAGKLNGAGPGDGDIALAARRHLTRTADVLPDAEAAELIAEGRGQRARNLGLLRLEGTHYADEDDGLAQRGLSLDGFDDDVISV